MSRFDELLTDLEEIAAADALAKASAMEEDELLAKASHAEPDEDNEGGESDGDEDNESNEGDEDDDGDEDDTMSKSFHLTLPDGTEAEAIDGTLLIKSLRDEMTEDFQGLAKAIKAQTALIKSLHADNQSLRAQVETLAKSGRGRKSAVLTVHEKPDVGTPADAQPEKPEPRGLMAKALDAQRAGRLSSIEVSTLDLLLGAGKPVPETLLAKIGG